MPDGLLALALMAQWPISFNLDSLMAVGFSPNGPTDTPSTIIPNYWFKSIYDFRDGYDYEEGEYEDGSQAELMDKTDGLTTSDAKTSSRSAGMVPRP